MTARLSHRVAFVARLAGLTLAYVVAGRLGLSLAYVNASASPIWPPTGIAVAALGAARLIWVTWWMGGALGAVLYAPALILLWTDRRPRTRLEQLEGLVVLVALVVVAAAVFRYGGEPARGSYPLGFLCIPLA